MLVNHSETQPSNDHAFVTYHVKATSKQEAINFLAGEGVNVHGEHNETEYDCTGLWYAQRITKRAVSWSSGHGCYVIKQTFLRDW